MEAIMEKYKLWLENYWYHYKYHTLLTLLALITCIVGLSQCSVSEEYDMYVSYAGPKNLYSDDIENGERALESVLDTDFSGDGKVNVSFNRFFYMSPDEVREAKENDPAFSVLDQSVALDSFKREFEAGDTVIWLVSPALYEESFARAKAFFADQFPAGNVPFVCHSWLLYPCMNEFVSEKSNVRRFMEEFEILSWDHSDGESLWCLFDTAERHPDRLPTDTSLRRAFVKRLQDGGRVGWGYGILFR